MFCLFMHHRSTPVLCCETGAARITAVVLPLFLIIIIIVGRDNSVGIATHCWLDGPEIESRWGARFSAPVQTGPGAHPSHCTMGTGSFPGVKRPGRGAEQPPPSKCRGQERVGLYLYSPSGPFMACYGNTFNNNDNNNNLCFAGFRAFALVLLLYCLPSILVLFCFVQCLCLLFALFCVLCLSAGFVICTCAVKSAP